MAATCASRPTRRDSGAHLWAAVRASSRHGSATVSTVSTRSTSVSAPTASVAVASPLHSMSHTVAIATARARVVGRPDGRPTSTARPAASGRVVANVLSSWFTR